MSTKLPQVADLSSIFAQHFQYLMILTSGRGAALTHDRTRSGGVNQIGRLELLPFELFNHLFADREAAANDAMRLVNDLDDEVR